MWPFLQLAGYLFGSPTVGSVYSGPSLFGSSQIEAMTFQVQISTIFLGVPVLGPH